MARFLLLARSTGKSGRIKGDPVAIVDNSHVFSEGEDKELWLLNGHLEADWPGTFIIVDVPELSLVEAKRMDQIHDRPAIAGDPEFDDPDEANRFVILGRHRWNLNIDGLLPAAARNNMNNNAKAQITKNALNNHTIDRSGLDDVLVTDTPRNVRPRNVR